MESISGSVVPLAMFLFSLSQQCHYKQIHILVIFKALVLPVHLPISLFWLCQFHCSLCQWGWEPKTVALSTTRCCQCGVTLKSVLVLVFCICVKLTLTMVTVISVCICVFTCNGQLINFAAATCCSCCLLAGHHWSPANTTLLMQQLLIHVIVIVIVTIIIVIVRVTIIIVFVSMSLNHSLVNWLLWYIVSYFSQDRTTCQCL